MGVVILFIEVACMDPPNYRYSIEVVLLLLSGTNAVSETCLSIQKEEARPFEAESKHIYSMASDCPTE